MLRRVVAVNAGDERGMRRICHDVEVMRHANEKKPGSIRARLKVLAT
jgi:hypothetical protein